MNYYRHRFLCDILQEMRVCCKTLNFSSLLGLVEECQVLGNRMENALEQQRDILQMDEEWTQKKKKLEALEKEIKELQSKKEKLDEK